MQNVVAALHVPEMQSHLLLVVSIWLKHLFTVPCRQAVNDTMQKFGLKTTKSKRARRETEAEEEAEAALQFKVDLSAHLKPHAVLRQTLTL